MTGVAKRRQRNRWNALAHGVVVVLLVGTLSLVGKAPGAGAAPTGDEGFRLVGQLPDSTGNQPNGEGALLIDAVNRLALQWAGSSLRFDPRVGLQRVIQEWIAYDLDTFERYSSIAVFQDPDHGNALAQATKGDRGRMTVDTNGRAPIMVADPAPIEAGEATGRSRFAYSAGGALYEVTYDPDLLRKEDLLCGPTPDCLSKWVAPPNPGGIDDSTAFVPSGFSNGTAKAANPTGIAFDRLHEGPRVYMVGAADNVPLSQFQPVWLAGWDAAPGNRRADTTPELRRRWFYVAQSCFRLANRPGAAEFNNATVVFRKGEWLYTFCDGSADASAQGVLRIHLSKNSPFAPGFPDEMAPDGIEQFFPGVTGTDVETFGDPITERMYVQSKNTSAGGLSVLVFDGRASGRQGAYIGAFSIALEKNPPPAAGAQDPGTGRWYFQSGEGLRAQEGRLERKAEPTLFKRDLDAKSLDFGALRVPYVDPATADRGARILIWREADSGRCQNNGEPCYEIYEDATVPPPPPLPPPENTLNRPEAEDTTLAYSVTQSASGVRARALRGLSTLWPSSIAGVLSLEDQPPKPGQLDVPDDYRTDPFFYHVPECGANDRELVFSRAFESSLTSDGIGTNLATSEALAVDPDVHQKGAEDDRRTREQLAHPDPVPAGEGAPPDQPRDKGCLRTLFEALTGQDSAPEDGNFDQFGQEWPFDSVKCSGDEDVEHVSSPSHSGERNLLSTAVSGRARVTCEAGKASPALSSRAISSVTPDELKALISFDETVVTTRAERLPENGVRSEASATVRGLSIAGGAVHIDEIRATACVHTPGHHQALPEGETFTSPCDGRQYPEVNSTRSWSREFLGLSVNGTMVCGSCTAQEVVAAIAGALGGAPVTVPTTDEQVVAQASGAIGAYGWVRAAAPEESFRQGTTKGTVAVVQKDLLQQDADLTMNRDESKEWPALEIGIYRDAQKRGSGRWVISIGNVFAQAQSGVTTKLGEIVDVDIDLPPDSPVPLDFVEDVPATVAGSTEAEGPVTFAVAIRPEEVASSRAESQSGTPGLLKQIAEGLRRSIAAALLLGALWTLVYGPVYIARRRSLLQRVLNS